MSLLITIWVAILIFIFIISLQYVEGWGEAGPDDPNHPSKLLKGVISPQYGGYPVLLNQMLVTAKNNADPDMEGQVHFLRKKYFKNRRSPEEKRLMQIIAEKKFVAKYGVAGEKAISITKTQAKLDAMTVEERSELLKEVLITTLPPKPKPKSKKGK